MGVGAVAGIGFTVSLFIAGLAYADPELLDASKIGVLGGSVVAAVVGAAVLLVIARHRGSADRGVADSTRGPARLTAGLDRPPRKGPRAHPHTQRRDRHPRHPRDLVAHRRAAAACASAPTRDRMARSASASPLEAPEPQDSVVEDVSVPVYVGPDAKPLLDDGVLDATTQDESVTFTVGPKTPLRA